MKQILLISALIFCGSLPVYTQWIQTNGPEGGRVTCLTENGTQIFAGTDGGGVYRSSDNGMTWHESNRGLTFRQIHSIASYGTYMFLSTDRGVFRSKDGGNTWKIFNDSLNYSSVNNFTFNDSIVFAAADGGIFKTTLNGNFWTKSTTFKHDFDQYEAIVYDRALFITNRHYIHRSTDNGLSWVDCPINGETRNLDILFFAFTDSVFIAAGYSSMYISRDRGRNWQSERGWPSEAAALIASGNVIIIEDRSGSISRSLNHAKTWTKLSHGLGSHSINCLCAHNTMFFAGTDDGIYCSRDSGSSWSRCNTGLFCAEVNSIVNHGSTVMASVRPARFFQSTDDGVTWQENRNGAFIAGEWGTFIGSVGHYVFASVPSRIYRSSDNGNTWNELHLPSVYLFAGTDEPFSSCISDNHIIFATIKGIFLSSDSGETWSHVFVTDWKGHRPKLASDGKNVIAGIDDVGFLRSSDKGKHWKIAQAGDLMKKWLNNVAIHGNHLYAVMGGDRGFQDEPQTDYLYRTGDNGTHWKMISSSIRHIIPFHHYLFTCYGQISYSKDDGDHWIKIDDGLPSDVNCIAFNKQEIFVGTSGAGVWRRPINEIIKSY